jgi:hypothetical protein
MEGLYVLVVDVQQDTSYSSNRQESVRKNQFELQTAKIFMIVNLLKSFCSFRFMEVSWL